MRAGAPLVLATLLALSSGNNSSASAPSITANILIVKSHAEIAKWVVLDPAKRAANVGRMRIVTRGQKIYFPLIATFSDSQVGQTIALKGVIRVVAPNGHAEDSRYFANQVDPRAPKTIVLEPVMFLIFDDTDPDGEYTVAARIRRGDESVGTNETFRLQ